MAGYRPKSLEELNSLYDKSINVKNEIDKKASDLEVKHEAYVPEAVVIPTEEAVQEPEKIEDTAEEITGLVDDFIKSFGAPAPIKKVRPVAPTTLKAVSSVKNDELKAPVRQSAADDKAVAPVSAKPRLIRNSERNDLFEDYKKVMDDDDDDDYSRHLLGRKRSKKRHEKKAAAAQENVQQTIEAEQLTEEVAEQEVTELTDEAAVASVEEIPETLENIEAVIEKVLGVPSEAPAEEVQQEAEEPYDYEHSEQPEQIAEEGEAFEESAVEADLTQVVPEAEEEVVYELADEEPEEEYETFADETEQQAEEFEAADEVIEEVFVPVKEKKSFKTKNFLLCALLAVLLLATAVSAVKAFAGINSDSLVFEKYHLYTATENYAQARIKKGDLVVVVNDAIKEGDIFAYKKGEGEYGFAELQGILNEDSVIVDKDGQKSIVFRNTLRGVLHKTYPAIGSFAAVIASYYLYLTGGLMLVALALVLVLILAFRKRKDDVQEKLQYEQVYIEEADGRFTDDVEGDFRYLIQDDAEESYDVSPSDNEEEGLPVYEADEYKYEPDEYVKN